MRAKVGIWKMPIAMIDVTMPGPDDRGEHDRREHRRKGKGEVGEAA